MAAALEFNSDGVLPPGDYPLNFAELRESLLVLGPADKRQHRNWDSIWRGHLVDNLEVLVRQLWEVGISEIFIDGSFAEDKEHPHDMDGYFVCDLQNFVSGQLERRLNLLDPHKVWTWREGSRRPCQGFPHLQLPMWHQYRVELYPHTPGACSGLKDEFGNELEFPSAFRISRRNRKRRGIVKVMR